MHQQPVYPYFVASNPISYDQSVSVLIVGAGPTGLAAANLLGLAGIDTLIVEQNAGLSNVPRAISIDDEGLRICQAMGLSDAIRQCIMPDISAHYVSNGQLLVKVTPTSKHNGYPLISTFYQPQFETALLQGLQRFPSVTLCFQHSVEAFEQSDTGVIVSIRTPEGAIQKVHCAYLLACDGGRSTIRRAFNIPMQGSTAPQKWLVVDCINDASPSSIVTFFCNPQRPTVSVPFPHNGRRWEFMLLPHETEKEMLKTETIAKLIQQAGGSSTPHIIRQTIYTFNAALAKTFSQGRVFLLGDAAHMMPPFGGQGLNSGLRDAHNLTWKLAMVLKGLARPHLLDTYHQERYTHVAQMIQFSAFLGNIVMSTTKPVASCRNTLLRLLNSIPPIHEFLTEIRIKPQPKYKTGFLLTGGSKEEKATTGSMLPQPQVTTMEGHQILLDDILGTGFALLRLHPNPAEAFASLQTDFWQRLGAAFICITGNSATEAPYIHPSSEMTNPLSPIVVRSANTDFLHSDPDLFFVVRPDRYIFGVFKEEKADTFVSAFQRTLQRQI
jgi:3-(3-hydroxy-phenyl)propionate hydroxylase